MDWGPLEIDRGEALRYAGHRSGALTPELSSLLEDCIEEIRKAARPRMIYRLFQIQGREPVLLQGSAVSLEGQDIAQLLHNCHACILLAVTLGAGVEQAIRQAQVTDMTRALLLDAAASAAVESACNLAQEAIRQELGAPPPFFTRRYSPGYGDLPLTLQRPFLNVLDAGRKIGLYVSESGILTPRKSVTAVIGLSDKPSHQASGGCEDCPNAETCIYRKEGVTCEATPCSR